MALVHNYFSAIKEGDKKKLLQYMYAVSQEDTELILTADTTQKPKKPWDYCDYFSYSICDRR